MTGIEAIEKRLADYNCALAEMLRAKDAGTLSDEMAGEFVDAEASFNDGAAADIATLLRLKRLADAMLKASLRSGMKDLIAAHKAYREATESEARDAPPLETDDE